MYTKQSDKLYRTEIDGKLTDIFVPYCKTELIFQAFISSGGQINEEGQVDTDPLLAFATFKTVGNVLLTEYDQDGNITKNGNCAMLSPAELRDLFLIGKDSVENFISALGDLNQTTLKASQSEEKSPKKAQKKD